jgi:hypothetical protein
VIRVCIAFMRNIITSSGAINMILLFVRKMCCLDEQVTSNNYIKTHQFYHLNGIFNIYETIVLYINLKPAYTCNVPSDCLF